MRGRCPGRPFPFSPESVERFWRDDDQTIREKVTRTIAADTVDPEDLERPRAWDIHAIRNFMIIFGLVSSAFDILTFVILRAGFSADAEIKFAPQDSPEPKPRDPF